MEIQAIRGDDLASVPLINATRDTSDHLSSSVIIQVENEVLMFFGDKNGSLLKVLLGDKLYSYKYRI